MFISQNRKVIIRNSFILMFILSILIISIISIFRHSMSIDEAGTDIESVLSIIRRGDFIPKYDANGVAYIEASNGQNYVLNDNGDLYLVLLDDYGGIYTYESTPLVRIANPHFSVQYYANIEMVAYNDPALRKVIGSTSYTNELPVIDTSGGKLPQNGGGSTASPNGNEIRNLYVDMTTGKLQTKTELTEIYTSRSFDYFKAPTITYMSALVENSNYELKEVWILKEGKEADSTDKNDWDIHIYSEDFHFTNGAISAESGEYVLISDASTIRFVYDTTEEDKEFDVSFYDYDIGDGRIYSTQLNAQKQTNGKATSSQGSGTYHMRTNQSGINHIANYSGDGAKLAFGNANTGSGWQHEEWNGNLLNKKNATQSGHPSVTGSYKGCTFGLVTGLSNGMVQYADGVDAPNLFNDGIAVGKTNYDHGEFSLEFKNVGDTYTLSAVNGTGTDALDTFNHPSPNASTVHNHIWTNNFWPMDSAPSFGTDGHDMKFGDYTNRENYKFAGQAGSKGGSAAANGTFPWSDDGEDHNSYFGMHYEIEFELIEEYVGPLEYYFFGDDDMWVFLDNELIADIGGIHSSVGEYVNLWDYLEKGSEESAGKHILSFFWTERGESGSTCWMQFTLPSVTSLVPETNDQKYGQLKVEKDLIGVDDYTGTQEEFSFVATFKDIYGFDLLGTYPYSKYDADGKVVERSLVIGNGSEFTLKDGEYILISYLPAGTSYYFSEAENDYLTRYIVKGEEVYGTGVINFRQRPGVVEDVLFVNSATIKQEVSPGEDELLFQGDEVIYEIEWLNDTNENTFITITDELDIGFDLIGVKFNQSDEGEWVDVNNLPYTIDGYSITYNSSSRELVWRIENALVGDKGVVSLKVKVNNDVIQSFDGDVAYVENKAQLMVGNKVKRESQVIENPIWIPIKSSTILNGNETVHEDDEIEYKINWRNSESYDATIFIRDTLDVGLDYIYESAKAYYSDGTEIEDVIIEFDSEKRMLTWDLKTQASNTEGYVIFKGQVNKQAEIKRIIENQAYVKVGNKDEMITNKVTDGVIPTLPKTGGIGVYLFLILGLIFIVIASIIIRARKIKIVSKC